MKRFYSLLTLLLFTCLWAGAVPALRQWQRHTQPDGTQLNVRICGDEHLHFYETEDGKRMELHDDGYLRPLSDEVFLARNARNHVATPSASPGAIGAFSGLFILVEFTDVKFSRPDIKTVYDSICNYREYTTPPYYGSVRDYFLEQSDGLFDLTLDVVGPVTLPHPENYYGGNGGGLMGGVDDNIYRLPLDALELVADSVDFSRYDWDGDGEADQVFLLYAGYGEAQGGPSWTIWPSEGTLKKWGVYDLPVYDGITINTFACACELHGKTGSTIDGIGTICHEFSHCLGLPDFYNANDMDDFCMDAYDVMDTGAYNGGSYCPAAYTGYERWFCGWREPIELTEPQLIDNWKPLTEGGATYILYNEGNRNEYYLLDNRQYTGFDSKLYCNGMVVMHVDYDASAWANNQVNTNKRHQRLTLVPADNIKDVLTCDTDAFPYTYLNGQRTLDSLTNTTHPKTELFNKNRDGSYLLSKPVYSIRINDDQSMSFGYLMRNEVSSDITETYHLSLPTYHCYDMWGRQLSNRQLSNSKMPKGVYIVNGRKVLKN